MVSNDKSGSKATCHLFNTPIQLIIARLFLSGLWNVDMGVITVAHCSLFLSS